MLNQIREDFDKLMAREVIIKKVHMTTVHIIFLVSICIISFLMRFSLRHIVSQDVTGFLNPWMDIISHNGGFKSLSLDFANYNYPYMYILCLISYLDTSFSSMYLIKLVSIIFDYISAFIMFLIIYEITQNTRKSCLGFAGILLLPTVFLNSSAWAQCDIIYVTFLLLSYYCLLKNKSCFSMLFFGLSFSFKLQAIFFLPFLIILWLKRKVRLTHFTLIPAVFILTSIPALCLGKSFSDILAVYIGQTGNYPDLTMNYPNIYSFVANNEFSAYLSSTGLYLTVAFLGCLAFYIYTHKCILTRELMITTLLFSVSVTIFCLPHMHERYGFMLDIFSIIYCLTSFNFKKLITFIIFNTISLLSYIPFLFYTKVALAPLAVIQLLLILYVGYDLFCQLSAANQEHSKSVL